MQETMNVKATNSDGTREVTLTQDAKGQLWNGMFWVAMRSDMERVGWTFETI